MSRRAPHPVRSASARMLGGWRAGGLALCLGTLLVTLPAPAVAADPRPDKAAAEPRSLLPLAQPLWSELSPAQRETLAPLESRWNGLPLAKKRAWLTLTEKMPTMSAGDRAKAQARIQEWASLTPEQRRMARNNYRLAKSLDRDERLATWESYNLMTPEQRSVLRANGWTSNTAARHAGAPTGLAKEAARPLTAVPVAPTSLAPAGKTGTRPESPRGTPK